jgi:hypothetical protein
MATGHGGGGPSQSAFNHPARPPPAPPLDRRAPDRRPDSSKSPPAEGKAPQALGWVSRVLPPTPAAAGRHPSRGGDLSRNLLSSFQANRKSMQPPDSCLLSARSLPNVLFHARQYLRCAS